MHIDTGHNFPETIEFRDALVAQYGVKLIVGSVQESIDQGKVQEETGYHASRNKLQTVTLLDTIEGHKIDCAIGGGRRDEEKARARNRSSATATSSANGTRRTSVPELWNLYNGRKRPGEHFRAFPIDNWTEMDVWQYILHEGIDIPSIYFSHQRPLLPA